MKYEINILSDILAKYLYKLFSCMIHLSSKYTVHCVRCRQHTNDERWSLLAVDYKCKTFFLN